MLDLRESDCNEKTNFENKEVKHHVVSVEQTRSDRDLE